MGGGALGVQRAALLARVLANHAMQEGGQNITLFRLGEMLAHPEGFEPPTF